MFCPKCGTEVEKEVRYCSGCGHRVKESKNKLLIFMTGLMLLIVITIGIFIMNILTPSQAPKKEIATTKESAQQMKDVTESEVTPQLQPVKEKLKEPPKGVSEIINASQPKVFTIFTDFGQGSGFLINRHGDILTNAHVVEGSLFPIIKTIDGHEYKGTLIGYSNTTDVALIRVPALANQEPLQLEETKPAEIGDEVIALGSPQGFENTATLGNISGVNRTFVIEPFRYDGIYQTSAAISPGSSGGPLISKSSGKVVAINSARHSTEVNIGFSLPIYQIIGTVKQWVKSPLSQDEMISMFYYQDGMYYYQDYMDDYGYFEDGTYNDEYTEYYELPYEESWYDYYYWLDEYETEKEIEEYDYSEYDYGDEIDEYGQNDQDDYMTNNDDESGGYEETEGSNESYNEESNGLEEPTDETISSEENPTINESLESEPTTEDTAEGNSTSS